MSQNTLQAVLNALKSLVVLSKARCVSGGHPTTEVKPKNLYGWPSSYESDPDIISVFESKNIRCEHIKVKSSVVSYDVYEGLKKIDNEDVKAIKVYRALLLVYQAVHDENKIVKISVIWDWTRNDTLSAPDSMSDLEALEAFSSRRDAMLLIERKDESYDLKIPMFAYRSLLVAAPRLADYPINHKDRSDFMGKNTDGQGRSVRFVIREENIDDLKKVVNKTTDSIDSLVGDSSWSRILKEDGLKYYS